MSIVSNISPLAPKNFPIMHGKGILDTVLKLIWMASKNLVSHPITEKVSSQYTRYCQVKNLKHKWTDIFF